MKITTHLSLITQIESIPVLFLTTSLLLLPTSAAPPTLPPSTLLPNLETNLSAEHNFQCFRKTEMANHLAPRRDCLGAIKKLPAPRYPGEFHIGGVPGPFRLPVLEYEGSCMVTVTIRPGDVDSSDWIGITDFFNVMIRLCTSGAFPVGRTGGWAYWGVMGRIFLTVEKYTPPGVAQAAGCGDRGGQGAKWNSTVLG